MSGNVKYKKVFPLGLTDRLGNDVSNDDVLFDGVHFYRIYQLNENEIEMISCTNGYRHDIKQKDMKDFKRVGTFKGNENLFECD